MFRSQKDTSSCASTLAVAPEWWSLIGQELTTASGITWLSSAMVTTPPSSWIKSIVPRASPLVRCASWIWTGTRSTLVQKSSTLGHDEILVEMVCSLSRIVKADGMESNFLVLKKWNTSLHVKLCLNVFFELISFQASVCIRKSTRKPLNSVHEETLDFSGKRKIKFTLTCVQMHMFCCARVQTDLERFSIRLKCCLLLSIKILSRVLQRIVFFYKEKGLIINGWRF